MTVNPWDSATKADTTRERSNLFTSVLIQILLRSTRYERGEVLVSGSTVPNICLRVKKAGAIIDEGGHHTPPLSLANSAFLHHRHENRHESLKDGDMVEVDAERGVVKILAKAEERETTERIREREDDSNVQHYCSGSAVAEGVAGN